MRLEDTAAARIVAERWLAADGIRAALAGYGIGLEDVGDWSRVGRIGLESASTAKAFEARFVGAISAAIMLGIELARHDEVS